MLVLSRRRDESLVIDGVIRITILNGGHITRLGIDAPRSVSIVRSELLVDPVKAVPASAEANPRAGAACYGNQSNRAQPSGQS